MLLQYTLASWAGYKIIYRIPLLPKSLPTKRDYDQGKTNRRIKWLKKVCWYKVLMPVPGTNKFVWKDICWAS